MREEKVTKKMVVNNVKYCSKIILLSPVKQELVFPGNYLSLDLKRSLMA